MSCLGNLFWLIFGGFRLASACFLTVISLAIATIAAPTIRQCLKFARLRVAPFSRDVVYSDSGVSALLNLLRPVFGGIESAFVSALLGRALCVTIVGIRLEFRVLSLPNSRSCLLGQKLLKTDGGKN